MLILGIILLVAGGLVLALAHFRHKDTLGVILIALGGLAILLVLLDDADVKTSAVLGAGLAHRLRL